MISFLICGYSLPLFLNNSKILRPGSAPRLSSANDPDYISRDNFLQFCDCELFPVEKSRPNTTNVLVRATHDWFYPDSVQLYPGYFELLDADIDHLLKDPKVLSISPALQLKPSTRWTAGYIETGNQKYDWIDGRQQTPRLSTLDGTGEIVQVVDTGLDFHTCLFADPAHPTLTANTTNMDHRKIVRYDAIADFADYEFGHGTHVAGFVAGSTTDPIIKMYNGVAPNAKIHFVDIAVEKDILASFDREATVAQLETLGGGISTNSWGQNQLLAVPATKIYDKLAAGHDSILFLFAAGNDGPYGEIHAPGNSKNVLEIGASDKPQSANIEWNSNMKIGDDKTWYPAKWLSYSASPFDRTLQNIPQATDLTPTQFEIIEDGTDHCNKLKEGIGQGKFVFILPKGLQDCPAQVNANVYEVKPDVMTALKTMQKITVISEIPEDLPPVPRMLGLSPIGPSQFGHIKPDLTAPGKVVGFLSQTNECAPQNLNEFTGTSESTPLVAGAATLIRQHLKNKPSSSLLRAILVNSAQYSSPIKFEGYGTPNVEKGITNLKYADRVEIGGNQDLFCEIEITEASDFSVTMAYLDPAVADESVYPDFADLDLYVVCPDSSIVRGNGREEVLATIEKVSIKNGQGKYQIHVRSHSFEGKVKFAVAVNVKTDSTLDFQTSSSCRCENEGKCESGLCICPLGFTGNHCTTPVNTNPTADDVYSMKLELHGQQFYHVRVDGQFTEIKFSISSTGTFVALFNDKNYDGHEAFRYVKTNGDHIFAAKDYQAAFNSGVNIRFIGLSPSSCEIQMKYSIVKDMTPTSEEESKSDTPSNSTAKDNRPYVIALASVSTIAVLVVIVCLLIFFMVKKSRQKETSSSQITGTLI